MKLTFTLCMLLLSGALAMAQPSRGQDGVPDVVKASFLSDFPNAQGISWQRQATRYVVDFVLNGYDQRAYYSGTGTWLQTEIKVPVSMMPGNAVEHARNRHPGKPFISTGYHDEENNRFYRIEIQISGRTVQLRYDDDGNFIGN